MAITSYIKTADPIVLNRLSSVLSNSSTLLTDSDAGKMGTREAHYITRNLNLSPTGTTVGIATTNTTPQDSLLGAETFDPQMSLRAISLYSKLSNLDTSRVELTFDPDSNMSYALYYANVLKGEIPPLACYAYLEFYSLYTAVIDYKVGAIFPVSDSEIDRILSNLRFIGTIIGSVGDTEEVYKLMYVVKYIQKAILFIRYGILSILG
jgi:hypothetical protein